MCRVLLLQEVDNQLCSGSGQGELSRMPAYILYILCKLFPAMGHEGNVEGKLILISPLNILYFHSYSKIHAFLSLIY